MKALRRTLIVVGILLVAAVVVYFTVFRAPDTAQSPNPQEVDIQRLQEVSNKTPEFYFQNNYPGYVGIRVPVEGDEPAARALNFMESYRDLYLQSNSDLQLQVRRVFGEEGESVTLYQTYQGIEVFGGEVVVELDGEYITSTVGNLLQSNITIDTIPAISASEAEEIASQESDWSDKTILGRTELMLFDMSLFEDIPPETHLAWRVTLGLGVSTRMFIDAHTGELILKYDLKEGYFDLDLNDANGSNSASTNCYWNTTADDDIATWGSFYTSYENDQDALDAYWLAYDTYNYFSSNYGRDSYDDNGGIVEVYVHATLDGSLAAWTYGNIDCDLIEFEDGCLAYDTFVHEFSHGVADFSSQLVDFGQPRALEESLADTLAMAADTGDWTLGEDHSLARGCTNNLVRDFANAGRTHWSEYVWGGSEYDNMEIHNHVVYLMGTGNQGEWPTQLTRSDIGQMYYYVLVHMPSNAGFWYARYLAIDFANTYLTPEKVCVVKNAYAVAGIGDWSDDWDCDGNPDFEPDADNVPYDYDNCPDAYNPDQLDTDGDGMGDACDHDDDADFVLDVNDNCPTVPNSSQDDFNNNGVGDVCEDSDSDGVMDDIDNCKTEPNEDQIDSDGDDMGDACDDDDDNDSILDIDDNCRTVPNVNQEDTDNDGIGDHCDDSDLDGVYDIDDNCINVPNSSQQDLDGDGLGDACDPDMDGDDVNEYDANGDPLDNCPFLYNPDQANADGDWIGDACDKCPNDADFIEAYSETFNLPGTTFVPEPYQPDSDGDGIPDLCDDDMELIIVDDEMTLTVKDKPGFLYLPLPACWPEEEGLQYGQFMTKFCVSEPLGENVAFWVGDDRGRGVTKSKMIDGQQCVEFMPLGGRSYTMVTAFNPAFEISDQATFNFFMDCKPFEKEEEIELLPTPTPTATPDKSRCSLFDQAEMSFTLFDIQPGSTDLTLYVKNPQGWLGIEYEVAGDTEEWVYTAFLGGLEAERCQFEGYAGRLYCYFKNLPMYMMDTTQVLEVYVNLCPTPIYIHEYISVIGPEETQTPSVLACRSDLGRLDCDAAGGTYTCTPSCTCDCGP